MTDADGDTPTVTVTGLPRGLSYASGQVSGTVAREAAVQGHTVTITANDGTNADVTKTFTITVTDVSFAPVIADPGDKTYAQGASITAFDITVTDADGDTPTVTVTGLPAGLAYASGQISGAVAQDAAVKNHTVTITANDGTHPDVTETFAITVKESDNAPRNIGDSTTVYVSINDPEGAVTEGSSARLPVRLTSSVGGTVQVPWTTSVSEPASKISGEAPQSRHEHQPTSGTVTIAAGQLKAIIEITILDDEEHEDLESFGIDLGEPSVASEASQKVVVDRGSARGDHSGQRRAARIRRGRRGRPFRGREHAAGDGHRPAGLRDGRGRRPAFVHPWRGRRLRLQSGSGHGPAEYKRLAGFRGQETRTTA